MGFLSNMVHRRVLVGAACAVALADAFAPTASFIGKPALAPRPSAVKAAPTLRAAKTTGAATLKAATAELPKTVTPGVVTGQAYKDLMDYAKEKGFAMPGVNIVGTNSINSCLEAAAKYGGPMIITFSKGGGQFIAGKAADNKDDAASIAGCIAGALHVRQVAKLYGVPVVLHTDHCQKAWLPWIDGLMDANEKYFEENGEPLFSSHMLDLSEEPLEENIAIARSILSAWPRSTWLSSLSSASPAAKRMALTTPMSTRRAFTLNRRRCGTHTSSSLRCLTACSRAPHPLATCTVSTPRATSTCSR